MSSEDAAAQQNAAEELPKSTDAEKEETAEEGGGSKNLSAWISTSASWGRSFLASAQQKTFDTLDLVKRDLSEFTDVVANEAQKLSTAGREAAAPVVKAAREQLEAVKDLVVPNETEEEGAEAAETVPEGGDEEASKAGGVGSYFRQLVDTVKQLATEDTTEGEEDCTEAIAPRRLARQTNISEARLQAIQTSESTFLEDPENEELFESWRDQRFSLVEHDGEINTLLANNPPMRRIYASLVPSQIDNSTFWTRYFYKIMLAELDEEMRLTLAQDKAAAAAAAKLDEPLTVETKPEPQKGKSKKQMAKGNKNGKDTSSSEEKEISPPSSEWSAVSEDAKNTEKNKQPTSGAQSADDWSIASQPDVQDLDSSDSPMTPRPTEGAKDGGAGKKDWVDWDE